MHHATADHPSAELTTIGASDGVGSGTVWPNIPKQVHNLANHLPAAMAEFWFQLALKEHREEQQREKQQREEQQGKLEEPQQAEKAQPVAQ